MANQHQPFRVHHIARAFRAAERAGIKNPHVRITLPGGGELHVSGGGEVVPQLKKSVSERKKKGPIGGLAFPARGGRTGT